MVTYDEKTDRVELAGVTLGLFKDEATKVMLRKMIAQGIPFSPSLTAHIHYAETRHDRCPNCKSKYHRWQADVNGVSIGFCLDCFAPLYRADNKIYRTSDGATGVTVWHNRLNGK